MHAYRLEEGEVREIPKYGIEEAIHWKGNLDWRESFIDSGTPTLRMLDLELL